MISRSPRARAKPASTLKTYSHLAAARRVPGEYAVATSDLLPYLKKGFEVDVPLASFYETHQRGSPLHLDDWESFSDPRETTYPKYVKLAASRETFVDGIFEAIDAAGYDASLTPAWKDTLARAFAPLRFPFHGMMMVAAYVGHMAPAGRVAIASLFQAADEVRRIQRVAYRMTQIAQRSPGFGDDARSLWERAPEWQPLRRTIEELFVTFDWGEAFAALDLCVKPLFDYVALEHLAECARASGDFQLGALLGSFALDAAWQRSWSAALARTAIAGRNENRAVLLRFTTAWSPRAVDAAVAYSELLPTRVAPDALARVLGAHLADAGVAAS